MPWLAALLWSALPVGDFALPDSAGRVRSLHEWCDRPVVIAFLGVDCPVSRQYASRLSELAARFESRGVAIVGIIPNPENPTAAIVMFEKDFRLSFPLLSDKHQALVDRLGVSRVPEVVVLDRQRRVRYRGRVDDQFSPGSHKSKPSRADLEIALEELLAGKLVSVPVTQPAGCPIERTDTHAAKPGVRATYYQDVVSIMYRRCVVCHQPGGIAPFSLLTAEDAVRKAGAIREAVAEKRMPPWHADPKYGKFASDPSLTNLERTTILDWCATGAQPGQAPETARPEPSIRDGWHIPKPDMIVPIPQPFAVPAEGVIPYQLFEVDPGFTEDRWVQQAEILPGNRAVVHHATVFLKPPGVEGLIVQGELQSFCLAAYAMGTPPMTLPHGMAKKIPRGWRLVFVIHYVPNGPGQTDQTRLGLRFADPKTVRKEVATNILISEEMTITPRCPNHIETRSRTFEKDVLLLALFPHMHLRGVSFRYEATYPDGRTEILLSVPKWDFEWQHRYVFAEPKFLPAGTVLTATGHYDNSDANPYNPDPNAEVHAGPQTTDEMFNGYYDFCLADEDLTRTDYRRYLRLAAWLGVIALMGLWWRVRLKKRTTV